MRLRFHTAGSRFAAFAPLAFAAVAGLAMGGCGKKEPAAEAPIAQLNKPEPEKPATPAVPPAPDKDRQLPAEADRKAPLNRTDTIKETFQLMEKGDLGQALRYLDKDVDWTEVGLPNGEFETADAVIAYQQKARTGLSDVKLRPRRVIESADYQVVEYVWSARHTGAFADGTPATNKVATVPGAMLVRYGEDGLIDDVWNFMDWPNVLQQLGLGPELPKDFRAVAIPGDVEVVIGAGDASYRERYVGFVGGLGPDQYKTTFTERTAPDFSWFDLMTGNVVTNHDGTNTYFADRRGAFVRDATDIETTIAAGPYFVAYVTNKLIYKGGYLGVPADNQKVSTHTLDIMRFDMETMRVKTLASYGNSYEILASLGMNAGGAATSPVVKLDNVMIEDCDDYVEDMRACLDSLEPTTREATRAALDQQIATWKLDTKNGVRLEVIKTSCEAATESAKKAYASSCPRVDWD